MVVVAYCRSIYLVFQNHFHFPPGVMLKAPSYQPWKGQCLGHQFQRQGCHDGNEMR